MELQVREAVEILSLGARYNPCCFGTICQERSLTQVRSFRTEQEGTLTNCFYDFEVVPKLNQKRNLYNIPYLLRKDCKIALNKPGRYYLRVEVDPSSLVTKILASIPQDLAPNPLRDWSREYRIAVRLVLTRKTQYLALIDFVLSYLCPFDCFHQTVKA